MAYYIGIDGGGTKTTCLVADETCLLGRATTGGSNVVRLGEEVARQSLQSAVRQACASALVQPQKVTRACVGLAGAARPEVAAFVRDIVAELVPGAIEVVGDNVIAMEAAFGSGPGVVVIAGTGSISFARNRSGESARAGGWGWAISDEGSAQWIGRQALAAAMRARDAGQPTALLDVILGAWGIASDELVRFANATPQPDYSKLFPAVLAAAEQRDPLAVATLERAAQELATLALTAMSRLWGDIGEPISVALVGGVFAHAPLVREAFAAAIGRQRPSASVVSSVVEPAQGALARARRAATAVKV